MNINKNTTLIFIAGLLILPFACTTDKTTSEVEQPERNNPLAEEKAFEERLETHLKAVATKNLELLKSTMSPEGKMQLILPGAEIQNSVDSFLLFHEEWFQDTSWTFETKILNTEVGERIGTGVTEIIYREPERNGQPYFNRMIVTYTLEKTDGQWYIIMDHASSVEKTEMN